MQGEHPLKQVVVCVNVPGCCKVVSLWLLSQVYRLRMCVFGGKVKDLFYLIIFFFSK